MTVTPLILASFWWYAASGDNCLSEMTKFDLCAFARSVQSEVAPSLPMPISSNITLTSALAIGPRVVFNATWTQTKAEVEAMTKAQGGTMGQLVEAMETMAFRAVCGAEELAAFVKLGGEIQYTYKTSDGHPIAAPLVSDCQQP